MSRKQSVKGGRGNKKCDVERKRDERAARRALAKDRRNRPPGEGPEEEFVSFTNQLQALGLKLREVPGDGNCLFRALGDQLEGHSRGHLRLRRQTVEFMQTHRADFEPFLEEDIPFTQHLSSLAVPGTFAGNDAIVAFARSQQVRVVIHQLNTPLWQINGSEKPVCRELHIAYRYGDHYDSVRPIGDNSESPAQLCIETLSRAGGQCESQCSQASRQMDRNTTHCTDNGLILHSLETESPAGDGRNCSDLSAEAQPCAAVWEEPDSDAPPCPALWEESGTGTRLFGPVIQTEQSASKPVGQPPGDSHTAKLSNRQRKEQQRQEKKRRQEERHRQKALESRATQNQGQNLSDQNQPVTLVRALNTLSI
ncbi:OTU domain-containing protein 3 [Amia ocellicauda]|uniref:OTU domain-containing protein 3 n=1 Tax=Amia ocellicauda TaxID=2972642 RepID=UPI0034643AE9